MNLSELMVHLSFTLVIDRWKGSSLKHHVEVVLAASDGTCCILREEDRFYN